MQKLASKPIPQAELNEPYREESGFSIEGPWHKRYIALYKKTASFDKHIAQRYDGMTGGHYLDGVLILYCEGIISDDEIAPLSDEPREFLLTYKKHILEDENELKNVMKNELRDIKKNYATPRKTFIKDEITGEVRKRF